jgi:hypothetical protein
MDDVDLHAWFKSDELESRAQRARGRLAPRPNAAKQSATDPDAHDLESFGTVCAFTARASSRAGTSRGAMCAHQQLRVG